MIVREIPSAHHHEPFTDDHLDAAARLLAARHCHDRRWAPDLSPAYEEPAATLPVLQDLLTTAGMTGVVALRGGHLLGYLLGAPALHAPTSAWAGFMHPRAAEIPYAGHAVDPDDGCTLTPRLYAALAQGWVTHGLVGHYVTAPVTPETNESWSDLGFGRFIACGVRATAPFDERLGPCATDLTIRRASAADEEAIQMAMIEFFRSFADPPNFVPFLPETAAERRRFVAEHLADAGCPIWIACADDRLVALQMFEEPSSTQWHQSRLQTPPCALYLYIAYTVADARSTGVGAALLDHTMAWARASGYDHCMAHWATASRAAAFWRGRGFRPVSYWLYRTVDERAPWADGQG